MKTINVVILLFVLLVVSSASSALAQSNGADFELAIADYQQSPTTSAAEKVIKLAVAMDRLPAIPEEARRHFVRGAALFKDATSPDDFTQVLDEFKQSARLAPWWPEARYNWALAYEAAGEYAEAIDHLNLYLLFKLPETEARTVHDKIYALEARHEKTARDEEDAEIRRLEEEERRLQSFEGTWCYEGDETCKNRFILITMNSNGKYSAMQSDSFFIFTKVTAMGRSLMIKKETVNGNNVYVENYKLSDDGKRLEGTYTMYFPDGSLAQQTYRTTLYRK